MIQHIRDYVEFVSAVYPVKGPVIEIGSYLVQGQSALADMRPLFRGIEYIGCDLRPGPGVDQIEDIHCLSFADGSVETLLVLETLEHVKNPFTAFKEMYRVLSPSGLLIISIPFYFPIHEFPSDYWRYTPYCLDMLLAGFNRFISWENTQLVYSEAKTKPRTVFALASKQKFHTAPLNKIQAFCQSAGHHFLDEKGMITDDHRDPLTSGRVYQSYWRAGI